jgi:hypothetical protein
MRSLHDKKASSWRHHFNRRARAAVEVQHLPIVRDLLFGSEFFRASLIDDANVWAERMLLRLEHPASAERFKHVKTGLVRLTVSPNATDFAHAASVLRNRDNLPSLLLTRFDGELRCLIYAAADGDCDSMAVVACEIAKHNDRLKSALRPLIGKSLPLAPLPCLQLVRMILLREFPHAAEVVDAIMSDLEPRKFAALLPTILSVSSGWGKTLFAIRFAKLLALPTTIFGCGGIQDSALGGTARRWSTGEPSLPASAIINARTANPILILDEIEKAGTSRQNGNLFDVLLSLFEPRSAAPYFDIFIQSEIDLSAVVWIATSNQPSLLPAPLRDRCRKLVFPLPDVIHLSALAPAILTRIAADHGIDQRWIENFSKEELAALANAWSRGSLRGLKQLI